MELKGQHFFYWFKIPCLLPLSAWLLSWKISTLLYIKTAWQHVQDCAPLCWSFGNLCGVCARSLHNHKESPIEILNGNWKESDTLTSLCRSHQVHGEVTRSGSARSSRSRDKGALDSSEKFILSRIWIHIRIHKFLPRAPQYIKKMQWTREIEFLSTQSNETQQDFCFTWHAELTWLQQWNESALLFKKSCCFIICVRERQRQQLASWHLSRTNFSLMKSKRALECV
jgi:hypothetical protein